jgi:hypothetical protein
LDFFAELRFFCGGVGDAAALAGQRFVVEAAKKPIPTMGWWGQTDFTAFLHHNWTF